MRNRLKLWCVRAKGPLVRIVVVAAVMAALTGAMGLPEAARAQNAASDPALEPAVFLLQDAIKAQPDYSQLPLVAGLRELKDPQLAPLFKRLRGMSQPDMKIQGLLGLAECEPKKGLDIEFLATVKDPALLREMVVQAVDGKLLDDAMCQKMLTWPDFDEGAKVTLAAKLIHDKKFEDKEMLRKAAGSTLLGRKAMASLLLLQLGEAEGLRTLEAVDQSTDPAREQVCAVVLNTADKLEFERVGPWALRLAKRLEPGNKLGLMALRLAMRFKEPGAVEHWRAQMAGATDLAQKMRLALWALSVAQQVEPETFDPLIASADATIQQIGKTGKAVAAKAQIAAAVGDLVKLNYPVATAWVLEYARDQASIEDAKAILIQVIQAYDGPARNQDQRLYDAMLAAQVLYERSPETAKSHLRPLLAGPNTNLTLVKGLLLGLLRSKDAGAAGVLDGLGPLNQPDANLMAVVLLARGSGELSPEQMRDLGKVVRGAGNIPPFLRIQATWLYLKRSKQAAAALTRVLEG